jgi:hypothetical protein
MFCYRQCPTIDPGARGDANAGQSNNSFTNMNEEAMLEGPPHKPQTVNVSSICCLLICCYKQLLF